MRIALPLIFALACDLQDLDDSPKPSPARRCDRLVQEGDRQYDNDAYLRCLHGNASPGDGGARD